MIDFKNDLNAAQFAAVTSLYGPVLVIAGAGSGKTRVIEYRVLNLVQNRIEPESILLLTFTRKAAREMLGRAEKHNPKCKNVDGGTFHSFAFRMLRKYGKLIGLDNSFTVLDEGDAEMAIQRCSSKLHFYEEKKIFPKKDTLRDIISASINKEVSIGEILKKDFSHLLEYTSDIEILRKEYATYKVGKNYVDYDDLLLYLKILLEMEEVNNTLSLKYQFVMVDEYQDTNKLQGDIIYLLTQKHKNVMIVGDDAQGIYSFRGATHKNIMEFPKKFPECKIIKLEENYRSTQSILDISNSILDNMKDKYPKNLVSARKEGGSKPCLMYFKNTYKEAEWIADKIKELRDEGTVLSHQAVLFRSSHISIPLQAELSKRNIPFQVFGGRKFNETAHVKDLMAHLRIIVNPRDELSWDRALMLLEGIGTKTSDLILEDIIKYADCYQILTEVIQGYISKGAKYSEGLKRFKITIAKACKEGLNVGERFEIILEYYKPILKSKFDDWPVRSNDLITLRQIAMNYDSLADLLTDFAIEPPEKGVQKIDPTVPEDEKPLTLSTIHSAKGLEWGIVYIMGLMDGVLPTGKVISDEDEIEEEHRLFYVGVTRAKNHLFLSMSHEGFRSGINQLNKLSRFVDRPNVLAKLEQNGFSVGRVIPPITNNVSEITTPKPDKKSLLNKVLGFFK